MNRHRNLFCILVFSLAALCGCSSAPPAKESKAPLDKIQGKAQVLSGTTDANDAALSAGGPAVFLWEGTHRYRLFLKTATDIVHGDQYVAEGINAQKAIDALGDPDQGKNGYPLPDSCSKVVKMAWHNLAFDEIDADTSLLCGTIKRYPARTVFLVERIRPASSSEGSAVSTEGSTEATEAAKNAPEVTVPANKQSALLIEGPTVEPAPLWQPEGGKISCQVVIGTDGKISDLETGAQLCEAVPWSQFRYQPPVQKGHPVKVSTEVEIRFEPRK